MAKRLNTSQLAERLGVSTRLLRYWRANNNGPEWGRYGARVEYLVTDVEAWEQNRAAAKQDYYNTSELSQLLELSETTIIEWRWRKKGPAYEKHGRRVAYPKNETDQWAKKNGYKK